MPKKSKTKSQKKEVPETDEEVVETVEVQETEATQAEESTELDHATLLSNMLDMEKTCLNMMREIRKTSQLLQRAHTKEVKAARKNRKSGNANRGSKEPSGFNKPQRVPKEFTNSPWDCDPEVELPRTVLTKKVYDYVKQNNLQDPKDKRIIHPDATVRKLFHLKKGDLIEFKTFQTHMAKLYKSETVSEGEEEVDDQEENEVVEVVAEKKSKKKKKKKKSKSAVAV